MTLQATVDVFSGRPNPTWSMSSTDAEEILGRIEENREMLSQASGYNGLGYRGIHLSTLGDGTVLPEGVPDSFWIANGVSGDEEHGLELAARIVEQGFSDEIGLRSLDGNQLIDSHVRDVIVNELQGFASAVRIWQESSEAPEDQEGDRDDNASALTTCTFEYGAYNPGFWNNDATRLWNNNCYAYACNMATDTFPQPGRKHGIYPSMYCYSVEPAAKADGLVTSTNCQPASANPRWYVALVVAPGVDYHWYRKQSEGYWGHKPGHTNVINTDNSGHVIWNPSTANRGIYTSWCDFMCVPRPNVSIS